jgi:hypothetical protein
MQYNSINMQIQIQTQNLKILSIIVFDYIKIVKIMFIFAGAKNTLLHILLNIAGMYYKIALLMRMYVQWNG